MVFESKKSSVQKIPLNRLLAGFGFMVLLFLIYPRTIVRENLGCYPQMVRAARQMELATREIREYRQQLNIPIDPATDPRATGFIGTEISPLTTTLGNPEAKQTALDPDFAALLVRWLWELGLKSGDPVALQLSGSFPSLNISAIIACETMALGPRISSSIGASSFGANLPEFTYLDMERRLYDQAIIHHRSGLVTGGGDNDQGKFIWADSDLLVTEAARRTGHELFIPGSLNEAIAEKWQFFNSAGLPAAFINVGGNHASLGNCSHSSRYPGGILETEESCQHADRGLLMYFIEKRIPAVHLLNIRSVAIRAGLPLLTPAGPSAGQSDIYFRMKQPGWVKILFVFLALFGWVILRYPQRIRRSSSTTSTRKR